MSERPNTYLGSPVSDWVEMLKSKDPLERRLAAHALGELGPAALSAVPALKKILDDPVTFVRVWAAAALAWIDPKHQNSVGTLIEQMKGRISFVRSLAAWQVGRLGPEFPGIEDAIPILWDLLEDFEPSVRTEAALALKNLEGKGAPPQELQALAKLSRIAREAVPAF